jgi:hypothetical protein
MQLRDDLMDDSSVDIGQAKITAGVAECQSLVIDPEEV